MSTKQVFTGARYAQDVLSEFHFSSPEKFGGGC
jgi:hypothetical protein